MVGPAMDSSVQVGEPILQVFSIFFPCHVVHSRRRLFLQAALAVSEQIDIHMVQQCREL
jgi:hypothetical protein